MSLPPDSPTLQQRKQTLLRQLEAKYVGFKYSRYPYRYGTVYTSTWDLANTPPFDEAPVKEATIRSQTINVLPWVIIFIIGIFICGSILTSNDMEALYFVPIISIFLIIAIGVLMQISDKKNTLLIHSSGLHFLQWQEPIPWHRVVGMWVKTEYDRHNQADTLVVHYYDERFDDFFILEAELSGLEKEPKNIAFLLEYSKQEAGFPTTQGY
jgi:hypothetical protein